jgi:hypothetical protein
MWQQITKSFMWTLFIIKQQYNTLKCFQRKILLKILSPKYSCPYFLCFQAALTTFTFSNSCNYNTYVLIYSSRLLISLNLTSSFQLYSLNLQEDSDFFFFIWKGFILKRLDFKDSVQARITEMVNRPVCLCWDQPCNTASSFSCKGISWSNKGVASFQIWVNLGKCPNDVI